MAVTATILYRQMSAQRVQTIPQQEKNAAANSPSEKVEPRQRELPVAAEVASEKPTQGLSQIAGKTEPPPSERTAGGDLPAKPSPRPSADAKNANKRNPEVKSTQVKERIEAARLAPTPETPPTKKVIQEEVKVTAKPKEAEVDKNKKPEPAKKEPETKVASIDKPGIKQPETPPPLPENRLLSLAIISAKRDINVKERVPLTVRGKYSDGNENEIVTGVRFESSDANVAAVNSRGEIEGKKEGKADVTARYAGVVSGVYTFYVKGVPEKPKEDQAGERLQDQRRRLLR